MSTDTRQSPADQQATERTTCRHCDRPGLRRFLDLGSTPVSNVLVSPDQVDGEPSYPLEVAFCEHCALVQLVHDVPELFPEDYPYYSSFSDHLLRHSADHANGLIAARGLGADSFVVELASNDGYLLKNFVAAGVPVLGIDPAPGPAAAAVEIGVPTRVDFFGREVARQVVAEQGRADVIIANNVMAHVPDLDDFVGGMKILLADDGVITVENPWVRELIDHVEFDTVYHEHVCYYSCTAVQNLMATHGLHLNHVEFFEDLHGGTLRWHIGHHDDPSPEARAFLADEAERGVDGFAYYESFGQRVETLRSRLLDLLRQLKADGGTVAAYGAAAKGATMLNYCGIGTDLVDYVVDRNVHKQGLLMPGTHQPIEDPSVLLERQPDHLLVLAWNFADEIMAQQQAYAEAGGRFIVPVPDPRVV